MRTETFVGKRGLILSYDERRALGDLQLEDGERLRFGGAAVARFHPEPGTEVIVLEVGHSYSGEPKATRLAIVGPAGESRLCWPAPRGGGAGRAFDLEGFAALNPGWADAEAARVRARPALASSTVLRTTLRPHPFFDPWREGVAKTAALALQLVYRVGHVAPGESRVGGSHAELSGPWPACAKCSEPLSLVAQLFFREFPALFDEGGSLAFLLCHGCLPRVHDELAAQGTGQLRYEPAGAALEVHHRSLAERLRGRATARRVEAVPHVSFPSAAALAGSLRSEAAEVLFEVELSEAGKGGARAYEEWVGHGGASSHLGGWPQWRGRDETPACPACARPMVLVAQLGEDAGVAEGETLYLFSCKRTGECRGLLDTRYVRQVG